MEQRLDAFCSQFLRFHSEKIPMVVITMTGFRGSAPQDPGARMIVGHKGLLFGTVGGGKIEKKCLDTAAKLLVSDEVHLPFSETWNLQRDIGMTCGGEVTMFFEVYRPQERWHVAVFGAGHVAQELTRLLVKLDCHVTVADSRPEWIEKLPTPTERLQHICRTDLASVLDELPSNAFVALMTMGHSHDAPVLHKALNEHNFPFLGVIGSDSKRNRLESEMRERGLQGERATAFICPLGEEFGSNAPVEIALSMVAQLIKERDRVFNRPV